MTLIREGCNKQFIQDLFCNCTGFNVLDDSAASEIKKRTVVLDNYVLIRLNSEETSSGRPMEFKYSRQKDGTYKYDGYRTFGRIF